MSTKIITWRGHQWRHKARINYHSESYRHTIYTVEEYCVKISSNSDKNSWRRSILKKNHDVTIMTSSSHLTSSVTCLLDSAWPLSYRLSIGTIPLSGFVSEIFSPKLWWRHQWRHNTRINHPWGPYTHTIQRNIVLKYRPIPTRIIYTSLFAMKGSSLDTNAEI